VSVPEETRRAVEMKLCTAGKTGSNLLYSLGDATKHWTGWDDLIPSVQSRFVQQILAEVASAEAKDSAIGSAASRASRTAGVTSRYAAMFARLRALQDSSTSLPQASRDYVVREHAI
jgi:hypothetical protein